MAKESEGNMSTKKPVQKPVPRASKKTQNAIDFFNDKKPASALFEEPDGRKKLKISPAAGKVEKKLINFSVNHEVIVLAVMVILISALAVWFIKQ